MMNDKIETYLADKLGEEFTAFKVRRAAVSREERAVACECVFPRVLTEAEKKTVEEGLRALLPAYFTRISLTYRKSYIDHEIIAKDILNYFERSFAAVASKMSESDLDIDIKEPVTVRISFDDHTYEFVVKGKLLSQLTDYLNNRYCNSFLVQAEVRESHVNVEQAREEILQKNKKMEGEAVSRPIHIITVDNCREFIGKMVEGGARYISDVHDAAENIVLAGRVKNVACKTVSSGKTLFKFTLEDFTGDMPCAYFPAQQNIERITDEFVEGTEIISRGVVKLDAFSRGLVFMPRAITMCTLPTDFVKPELISKPAPEEYAAVLPKRMEVAEQVLLFAGNAQPVPPREVAGRRFVVFDLETTGLDAGSCRITEIGAISIENGEIAESFSTLVNPEAFISEEITRLTGITEDMVKDAPVIAKVVPDFFRFTEGAVLVAHNIEFDFKFLDKNGRDCGYVFKNQLMDTLRLARENLKGLSNYKLNTVCDHLNVDLKGHHRAINDVLATAHVFLKLMRIKEEAES